VLATERGEGWREATAALWTLAIGSSIALVGQTYHIPGDWTAFLRTWLLLAAPVLYLLRPVTGALLYCLGLVAWTLDGDGTAMLVWPLLLLALPVFAWRLRRHQDGPGSEVLAWALAGTVAICLLPSLDHLDESLWGPLLASLFLAFWAGAAVARPRRWERPFRLVGGLGVVVVAMVLSYAEPWQGQGNAALGGGAGAAELAAELAVVGVTCLGAVAFVALAWRRHGGEVVPFALALPAVWLAWLLARFDSRESAAALANVYLLVLGALLLVSGLREDSLRRANAGTGVLGLLVLLRFFDTDWGFLLRGSAFIAVGLGFLLVNSLLLRRRRSTA
jgi:hypothetical protein